MSAARDHPPGRSRFPSQETRRLRPAFQLTAAAYDALHTAKAYEREAHRLRERLGRLDPSLHTILDVACGTGAHDEHLARFFEVDGLDLSGAYLEAARRRNPRGRFHQGDMRAFRLDRLYDAVLCLFGAIGYAGGDAGLVRALTCCREHLTPRGVVVVEPWLTPEAWEVPSVRWDHGEAGDLRVVCMTHGSRRQVGADLLAVLDCHYLVGTAAGVDHVRDRHELGLFRPAQMRAALAASGLRLVEHDADGGPAGGGLYVARAEVAAS